jgi:Domain of unknown function (DUF6285)
MQDRPTAAELLATVAGFLEDELMPTLDGPLGYRTRVAANLVRILERENALGPAALLRERELLCGLLDVAVADLAPGPLADQIANLNRRLVAAITSGRVEHARAWDALMQITRAKIAIIRPGYDAWDAQGEPA